MQNKKLNPVAILIVAVVLGGLLAINFNPSNYNNAFAKENIGAQAPPIQINNLAKQLNETFNSVSNAVIPTVVSINVKMETKLSGRQDFSGLEEFFGFNPFGGGGTPMPAEGSGSGVIISPNGYIVTNNHVIEDATEIKVTTNDKKTYTAKLIGADPTTDLAVIKIEAEKLPTAYLANIEDVKIGEMVLAVGNPLGLNSTITQGIISAIGRGQLNLNNKLGGNQNVENYIQTDAAINPGNSGGGLYDLNGSLIGINTAIASRSGSFIGYGFAVPIDLVKAISEDLIEDGKIDRGYIGVSYEPVNEAMAKALGMDKVYGAVVQEVVKKGAAEKAGIETGDIILSVDGKEINSSSELQGIVFTKRVGNKLDLSILRDGKKINKTVTLEALDNANLSVNENSGEKSIYESDIDESAFEGKINSLGITVERISTDQKNDFGVDYGILVNKVDRESVAYKGGIAPGTIILKADKQKLNTPADLNKIIKNKKSGDAILLQIKYKGTNRIVALII